MIGAELADVRQRFRRPASRPRKMLLRNSERGAHLLDGARRRSPAPGRRVPDPRGRARSRGADEPFDGARTGSDGRPDGSVRFVLSLRGISEGHISSIEFRTGIDRQPMAQSASTPRVAMPRRASGGHRCTSASCSASSSPNCGADMVLAARVLDQLPRHFGSAELETALKVLDDCRQATVARDGEVDPLAGIVQLCARVRPFTGDSTSGCSFPGGPFESRGMEDARFVRFVDDDGTSTYYATYTAFDGFEILPQLIETNDFRTFEISTMNGRSAQNKGIAFFPRPIDGRYMAVSRPDRENIHVMSSDNPRFWQAPSTQFASGRPWELSRPGTAARRWRPARVGWCSHTESVRCAPIASACCCSTSTIRRQVIAELDEPLLAADRPERDGYVPNVVYSCGGVIHGEHSRGALRLLRPRDPYRDVLCQRAARRPRSFRRRPAPLSATGVAPAERVCSETSGSPASSSARRAAKYARVDSAPSLMLTSCSPRPSHDPPVAASYSGMPSRFRPRNHANATWARSPCAAHPGAAARRSLRRRGPRRRSVARHRRLDELVASATEVPGKAEQPVGEAALVAEPGEGLEAPRTRSLSVSRAPVTISGLRQSGVVVRERRFEPIPAVVAGRGRHSVGRARW